MWVGLGVRISRMLRVFGKRKKGKRWLYQQEKLTLFVWVLPFDVLAIYALGLFVFSPRTLLG